MVWADFAEPEVNDLHAEAVLDIIRGDIEALHTPEFAEYHHPGTGGNYTVSGTLGQDLDSTNFALTITTTSQKPTLVIAMFYGQLRNSAAANTTRRAAATTGFPASEPNERFEPFHARRTVPAAAALPLEPARPALQP